MKVLFVCLGNICRSPLAEGIFKKMVADKGLAIVCDSAGTGDYHTGELPFHLSQKVAQKNGLELTHRARQINKTDFDAFDYILVMDDNNYKNVIAEAPKTSYKAKVHKLRAYDNARSGTDVQDPYWGKEKEFDECYAVCSEACGNFLLHVEAEMQLLKTV